MRHELSDASRDRLVNATPDPLTVLDMAERVNALPDDALMVEGVWDEQK